MVNFCIQLENHGMIKVHKTKLFTKRIIPKIGKK